MSYEVQSAQFDFEFMGKSTDEIARQYNLPLPLVNAEVDSKRWTRRLEPTTLPATKDLEEFAKQLESITRSRLTVISLFRQIDNQPLYAALETALLQKLTTIIENIHNMDDKAATKLLAVAKCVETIQAREPIELAEKVSAVVKSKGGAGGVQVLIQNNLGTDKKPTVIN